MKIGIIVDENCHAHKQINRKMKDTYVIENVWLIHGRAKCRKKNKCVEKFQTFPTLKRVGNHYKNKTIKSQTLQIINFSTAVNTT